MIDERDERELVSGQAADRRDRLQLPVLIPNGVYQVRSNRIVRRPLFDRNVIILECEVVGGRYDGTQLSWYAKALPRTGRIAPSAKLFIALCRTLPHPPTTPADLDPRHLVNHLFKAQVISVTRDSKRRPLPPAAWHAKISELLERLA